ncbi:uncharacterized protein OCT59_022006 [Rhizophagus irregularis]|uniref:uncharacterized protein n=1 Tax=Rhizophagus irregularis TaxID=588596 RepID=UPI0033205DE2|nr:hypothetical protein OCT59_022006 [Rhizophagus irregularis]
MLGLPKYNEKAEEHIRVKKAMHPKDGIIFDFMIRPPNDKSEIAESPLLIVLEPEMGRCPNINNVTTDAELELIEGLLQEANIEGFFCYRANQDRQPRFKETFKKLTIGETALYRKKASNSRRNRPEISDPNDHSYGGIYYVCVLRRKDAENGFYFDMKTKLDLTDFKINIIEYSGKSIKLKSLIDQAVTKGLIIYEDYNFLPYPINASQPNTDFFNLFLEFLAKPTPEINKEIMDPILWYVKNLICSRDERLDEYI